MRISPVPASNVAVMPARSAVGPVVTSASSSTSDTSSVEATSPAAWPLLVNVSEYVITSPATTPEPETGSEDFSGVMRGRSMSTGGVTGSQITPGAHTGVAALIRSASPAFVTVTEYVTDTDSPATIGPDHARTAPVTVGVGTVEPSDATATASPL